MRALLGGMLVLVALPAAAEPLSIRPGESWIFTVRNGDPANARKVERSAKPGRNQVMATVRSVFGTNLFMTNNSGTSYTFRAELMVDGKAIAARPCDLPNNNKPILEQWPQKAEAVRIGRFKARGPGGRC